jgi:glutathione peroxidase
VSTLSDFQVQSVSGDALPLTEFAGQVVVVVNVASQCGMTPQYAGLEKLYRAYRDRGFTVLGCPCNQFGGQEPGTEAEISSFCELNYDVTFPLTAKMDVNGDDAHPMWTWLKEEQPGVLGTRSVKWNFTKFLVGRDGEVIERFSSREEPEAMIPAIETALAAKA